MIRVNTRQTILAVFVVDKSLETLDEIADASEEEFPLREKAKCKLAALKLLNDFRKSKESANKLVEEALQKLKDEDLDV